MNLSAAKRFQLHHLRPMPVTTMPVRVFGEYKGERLHPDVERRIAEYRKVPSLYGEPK